MKQEGICSLVKKTVNPVPNLNTAELVGYVDFSSNVYTEHLSRTLVTQFCNMVNPLLSAYGQSETL